MVKKGGTKRKIPIEKKTSRGPCCSKRYQGLFGKASQFCLLSGAQIAVLATPMSDNSHVSFYSFGHSSVDAVVSIFLSGKRPLFSPENNKPMREDIGICLTQKNLRLGFWWEDEAFTKLQNPKELSDTVDSMRKLLEDAKQLRSVDPHQEPDQTLTTPAISNDFLQNTDTEIMSSSEDAVNNQQLDSDDHDHQDVKNDDIKKNDHVLLGCGNQEPDQTLNLQSTTDCLNKTKDTEVVILDDDDDDDDLPAVFNDNTKEHDQILAACQSFCATDKNALPADNFEGLDNELDMDIDQLIDYDSTFLDDWVSEYTLQEDGAFMLPTSLDERYICQL